MIAAPLEMLVFPRMTIKNIPIVENTRLTTIGTKLPVCPSTFPNVGNVCVKMTENSITAVPNDPKLMGFVKVLAA